jgi:hypothetical protein
MVTSHQRSLKRLLSENLVSVTVTNTGDNQLIKRKVFFCLTLGEFSPHPAGPAAALGLWWPITAGVTSWHRTKGEERRELGSQLSFTPFMGMPPGTYRPPARSRLLGGPPPPESPT